MSIHEIVWSEDRIKHIARHSVSPEEVEEVYFSRSLLLKATPQGASPIYYMLWTNPFRTVLVLRNHSVSRREKIPRHRTSNDRLKKNPDTDNRKYNEYYPENRLYSETCRVLGYP